MNGTEGQKKVPISRSAYFSIRGATRRKTFAWAGVAVGVAVAWVGVRWLVAGGPTMFQNGPLTGAHQRVATDCNDCHGDWGQWSITQDKCLTCHLDQPHPERGRPRPPLATSDRRRPESSPGGVDALASATRALTSSGIEDRAARMKLLDEMPLTEQCHQCHQEHRGHDADLTLVADVHCRRCHQIAGPHEGHPEFALKAAPGRAALARSATGLGFVHATHWTGNTERKIDDCMECHELEQSGARFSPPRFEQHCRVCHAHDLAAHKSTPAAPEGLSEALEGLGEYSRFALLAKRDWTPELDALVARKRSLEDQADAATDEATKARLNDEAGALDERIGALEDAREVLEGTSLVKCLQCHTLTTVKDGELVGMGVRETRYRPRWFTSARFDHRPHMQPSLTLACTDCHAIPASGAEEAKGVMLPGIAKCAECHHPTSRALSHCTLCHDYHDRTIGVGAGHRFDAATATSSQAPASN